MTPEMMITEAEIEIRAKFDALEQRITRVESETADWLAWASFVFQIEFADVPHLRRWLAAATDRRHRNATFQQRNQRKEHCDAEV